MQCINRVASGPRAERVQLPFQSLRVTHYLVDKYISEAQYNYRVFWMAHKSPRLMQLTLSVTFYSNLLHNLSGELEARTHQGYWLHVLSELFDRGGIVRFYATYFSPYHPWDRMVDTFRDYNPLAFARIGDTQFPGYAVQELETVRDHPTLDPLQHASAYTVVLQKHKSFSDHLRPHQLMHVMNALEMPVGVLKITKWPVQSRYVFGDRYGGTLKLTTVMEHERHMEIFLQEVRIDRQFDRDVFYEDCEVHFHNLATEAADGQRDEEVDRGAVV